MLGFAARADVWGAVHWHYSNSAGARFEPSSAQLISKLGLRLDEDAHRIAPLGSSATSSALGCCACKVSSAVWAAYSHADSAAAPDAASS